MSEGARSLAVPALQAELYPERRLKPVSPADRMLKRLEAAVVPAFGRYRARRLRDIVRVARMEGVGLSRLDNDGLRSRAVALAQQLRADATLDLDRTGRAFALIREAAGRVLGMRHHDVQLMGGYALVQGMIAEMNTGEGKTLTATLASITMALCGKPVHVVTVNDYLARRDAEKLQGLYQFFGLRVGVVVEGMEPQERRAAYACDVTYCTNKELAFDYLKDRLALAREGSNMRRKIRLADRGQLANDQLLLRGLHFAIVDEADSVMIDEARTPLILSGEAGGAAEIALMRQALTLAETFERNTDFLHSVNENRIELLAPAYEQLERQGRVWGGVWQSAPQREDMIIKALTALHVMKRDHQYIVRDAGVSIVDEYTGRIMADRFWSDGLHQMVELKEGLEPSPRRLTLARMTYQRFFRRYLALSGMSGTVQEVAGELWEVYGLKVARIPTHRPIRRKVVADVVFPDAHSRWEGVVTITRSLIRRGVPVLIGTRSVAASVTASTYLDAAGIAHRVLNARDEAVEAEIVAEAGLASRVTVATNMAGRGTDIELGPGVAEAGGLHVLMTERHDSGRIDRQLAGRAARQGDPGAFCAILSLDDPLLAESPLPATKRLAAFAVQRKWWWLSSIAMRRAQRYAEKQDARVRRELLKTDDGMDHALAFTGAPE